MCICDPNIRTPYCNNCIPKNYFCDNPKCKYHIHHKFPTEHSMLVDGGNGIVLSLSRYEFIQDNGKRIWFCAVCKEAIFMANTRNIRE